MRSTSAARSPCARRSRRLELNPESVLVIVGDELVTRDARLDDAARSRSARSSRAERASRARIADEVPGVPGAGGDRRAPAQRRVLHDHFLHHCEEQVRRAIDCTRCSRRVTGSSSAVSGGKDSLALWEILIRLGYEADGLYLGLGIGDVLRRVGRQPHVRDAARELSCIEIDLAAEYGYDIPARRSATPPAPCGACGLSKRHLFNRGRPRPRLRRRRHRPQPRRRSRGAARQRVALGRGVPRPSAPGAPGRRAGSCARSSRSYGWASGRSAAYCVLRGIDYQVEECPMAAGQPAPRVQGGAQRRSRSALRAPRRRSSSGSSSTATTVSPDDRGRGECRRSGRAACAAAPTPARCARSAGCVSSAGVALDR